MLLTLGCENSFMVQPEIFGEIPENIKETYPGLVAKYLNRKIVSLAKKRASNDYIVRSLYNWFAIERSKHDNIMVLISWTDPRRMEFCWERPQETNKVNWPNNDEIFNTYWPEGVYEYSGFCRRYLKLYSEYHINEEYEHTKWANQIIMVDSFLRSQNIPYIFCNSSVSLKQHCGVIKKYISPYSDDHTFRGFSNLNGATPGALNLYTLSEHEKYFSLIKKYL